MLKNRNSKVSAEVPVRLTTLSERQKLDASLFADPESRLFPIQSLDDLKTACDLAKLMPKTEGDSIVARALQIAATQKIEVPALFANTPAEGAGVGEDLFETEGVDFDFGGESYEEGDYVVYPQRKLFEAGWYESHKFGLTPEEMALGAFAAKEAPLDLEHKTTVIKEEYTGFGSEFGMDWEGDVAVLRTDVRVHKMLDPLLKDETKMSSTWDRTTKSLKGIALLLNPRVEDASLKTFAEFAKAKHVTRSGQSAIQALHDQSVRGGAVCSSKNTGSSSAEYASKGENGIIQQVHDLTMTSGATCESVGSKEIYTYYEQSGEQAGGENVMLKSGQNGQGAGNGGGTTTPPAGSEGAAKTPDVADAARFSQLESELASFKKREEKRIEDEIARESVRFADAMIEADKIDPKHRAFLIHFAETLLADDREDGGEITFTADKKVTRMEAVEQFVSLIPARSRTVDTLKVSDRTEARFLLGDDAMDADGDAASGLKTAARKRAAQQGRLVAGASTNGKGG